MIGVYGADGRQPVPFPTTYRMGRFFLLGELVKDGTNIPQEVFLRLIETCGRLDRARASILGALRVTSGYRTPEHNRAIGGSPTSQHITGEALDVVPYASGRWEPEEKERLANLLVCMTLEPAKYRPKAGPMFDQVETVWNTGHIHVSNVFCGVNRGEWIHRESDGTYTVKGRWGTALQVNSVRG